VWEIILSILRESRAVPAKGSECGGGEFDVILVGKALGLEYGRTMLWSCKGRLFWAESGLRLGGLCIGGSEGMEMVFATGKMRATMGI
jgi:hypothetical protein